MKDRLVQEPGSGAQSGSRTVARYTIGGFLFGLFFPISATLIDIALRNLPVTLESALAVQSSQALHLIIDTAPLVLAAAGWLAGVRQGRFEEASAQLDSRLLGWTEDLEANAARLQAVAEMGSFITTVRELDTLLEEVVNLIVERFGFYHAQVFLIDEDEQFAVLRASTGEVGKELLARGHSLEVGSRSVIGQVTLRGESVVARDTDVDSVHRRNELLPNTRSEMALPLKVSGRILGALDVQSVEADAFGADDIPIFQTMANQLAVAIDNVRLLEEAQRNLRDIEVLNRQLTGEAWRDFLAGRDSELPMGYLADEFGLHPVEDEVAPGDGDVSSLPIVVRGQPIGALEVQPKSGEILDEEVQAILEAVAERVALALDNTRLSRQAQRTAQVQQFINVLSSKLQHESDLNSILRVVAAETCGMLRAPRGFVQLAMSDDIATDDGR